MSSLRLAIEKVFKGAGKSFARFPGAIAGALVISLAALVRISMDWEVQRSYGLLFDSIQLSFLLGAVFTMAAVAWDEVRNEDKKSNFLLANLSGIALAIVSFLLLYFFGGKTLDDNIVYLSNIATARVSAAVFISAVAFVYMVSKAKTVDSFSDSFFLNHRAFIMSAIYGLVIMLGVSGVLGAFEALVYPSMDYRIYQYLGVVVGFLTYTIFLGYFPSFRGIENAQEIKEITEQPRFIYVLFEYILVPILMALTVVLLIWTVRVLLKGVDVSFNRLSGIASSYVIIGIWLHIMVANHETKLANFYKMAYPFAGILILAFEAWALFEQLNKFGLKTAEYSFLMLWIFAAISILLLIVQKEKAYRKIALVATVLAVIWVLPILGYQDITFNSQVKRLEKTLISEGLLEGDKLVATSREVELVKRGEITDAVDFISYSEKTNTPVWFTKSLNEEKAFKDSFGFEKTYGIYPEDQDYTSSNVNLETQVIDVSGYSLSLNMITNEKENSGVVFEGKAGSYEVMWVNEEFGVPKIIVYLDDRVIIEEDTQKYLADLLVKYPLDANRMYMAPLEDMSIVVEEGDISLLVIFSNVNIYYDKTKDMSDYYVNLNGIYVKFK